MFKLYIQAYFFSFESTWTLLCSRQIGMTSPGCIKREILITPIKSELKQIILSGFTKIFKHLLTIHFLAVTEQR